MNLRLELLQQHFTARYETRLTDLVRLMERGDFDDLYLAFHSMAGVAGTYGFPEITVVAREGEQHCENGDTLGVRRTVSKLVRLRESLHRAA